MNDELKYLVGKTIKEVRMEPTNTCIQFDTDEGVFSYITDEECCSESWINHISGLQAIIGQKVLKTEEIEMPEILEASFIDVNLEASFKFFNQPIIMQGLKDF